MARRSVVILLLLPALVALRAFAVAWAASPPQVVMASHSAAPGTIVKLPVRSNLIGGDWIGSGHILVRAKGTDHRWSEWVPLDGETADGPDTASAEAHRSNRTSAAVPLWVGEATHAQVRAIGNVRDITLVGINSEGTATSVGRIASTVRHTAADVLGAAATSDAQTSEPDITTRAEWGADESIRKNDIAYSATLQAAVIHHTVTSNTYSASESASIVRGIYTYHVKHNGWNDIGYNMLIDKYGQVFEGRKGGVTKNVLGAHAGGFNTNTTGVALLGTYTSATSTTAQRAALIRLLSWRLDVAHVDPSRSTVLTSAGNGAYAAGTKVMRRVVSGHRDLYSTSCPGAGLYGDIDAVRAEAWADGGPKVADPRMTVSKRTDGTVASIKVDAHSNTAVTWNLRVTNALTSATVGTSAGAASSSTSLTVVVPPSVKLKPWELKVHLAGTDASGTAARPYEAFAGTIPADPTLELSTTPTSGRLLSPNRDGLGETLTLTIRTNTHQTVKLVAQDAQGADAATLVAGRSVNGAFALKLERSAALLALADGRYTLRATSIDGYARSAEPATRAVTLNRSLFLGSLPAAFSPNGDGRRDSLVLRGRSTDHEFRFEYPGTTGALLEPGAALQTATWSGAGQKDGTYTVSIFDPTAALRLTRTVRRDTRSPHVSARRVSRGLRVTVDEAVTLTGWAVVSGSRVKRSLVAKRGTFVTRRFPGVTQLTASDVAANVSRTRVR